MSCGEITLLSERHGRTFFTAALCRHVGQKRDRIDRDVSAWVGRRTHVPGLCRSSCATNTLSKQLRLVDFGAPVEQDVCDRPRDEHEALSHSGCGNHRVWPDRAPFLREARQAGENGR
mmetsp:Transcript_9040/g.27178  ORF Transcript_9040/g.27178 Transcript_9040/m.27178 type:complete len:118 (-) Transcript_9040:2178-2531(-)